jgi:hypothetical protein
VGGSHHVRLVEELNNHLDGQIEAERWRSEEHHGLGYHKLLPLGALKRVNPRCMCKVWHDRDTLAVFSHRRR